MAITVENISKVFSLSGKSSSHTTGQEFNVLSNISFHLAKGEILGIMGNNGSGKSTLLKILSGYIKPSSGKATIDGKVNSILDIGSNFHPDLTGLENVEMNLGISGIDKQRFSELTEKIKAFSDIGDFFYEPVKHYSNGMFLRLAFSLAFHLDADVLLIDEVSNVGDLDFRLKSMEYIREMAKSDKTIVLVTHNRADVMELCDKCIWLEHGRIKQFGNAQEVATNYFHAAFDEATEKQNKSVSTKRESTSAFYHTWRDGEQPGNEFLSLESIELKNSNGNSLTVSQPIEIIINYKKHNRDCTLSALLTLSDRYRQPLMILTALNADYPESYIAETADYSGHIRVTCTVPANFLSSGEYLLDIKFGLNAQRNSAHTNEAFRYSLDEKIYLQKGARFDFTGDTSDVMIRPEFAWNVEKKD